MEKIGKVFSAVFSDSVDSDNGDESDSVSNGIFSKESGELGRSLVVRACSAS